MKPIYALTLCIGLLEGADAIIIPGSSAPNSGYAFRPDDIKSTDDSKSAGNSNSKTNSNSIFPVFGKTNTQSSFKLVRRIVKTGEPSGSDDDSDDSPDALSTTPSTTPWDTPSGPSDETNTVYPEPLMLPSYVRFGPAPVDKPVAASKSKSSKKKGSKGTVAKHGGDDGSGSGGHGHKQKGKDKGRGGDDNSGRHSGDDDATKSRSKTEDSPKTSLASTTSTSTTSSSAPTSPPTGDDSGKGRGRSKGKGRGGGKDNSGHHNGDDDDSKSRTRVDDSKTRSPGATASPTPRFGRHSGDGNDSKSRARVDDSTKTRSSGSSQTPSDDSGKGKGRGKGNSGKHSGDDGSSKSRTKTEDSTKTQSSGSSQTNSDDSRKGRGKGSGKGNSGKHSGDDDASKSRTIVDDSKTSSQAPTATPDSKKGGSGKHSGKDNSRKTSSKKGSKDDSKYKSKHSKKATIFHQSGKTFELDSVKGGGKNGPGYNQPFDVPKLNSGYIQAIPPKASTSNNKASFKVKPKPSLDSKINKVRPIYTSLHKRDKERILSLRAAAPFNSAPIDRSKWTVTCDSFNIGNECVSAIDGDSNTFWHTQWEGKEPAPPHTITVDLKKSYNINGISMLPRQDGSPNGCIAQHQVFLSKDNKNWGSPVAYGTWYADSTLKYANFDTQPARYVRLVALTEGNGNPWTSIAELNVFQGNDYAPFQAAQGAWGPTVNFPIIPVAGTVDAITGKVLVWSSWARDTMDGGNGGETLTSTWDPVTGLVTERQVDNTDHDMFCPGISLDGNGQLVVTGGNTADRTSLFDPVKQAWIPGPGMKVARGYQASATTSTGKVFTIGGSWSGGTDFKNGEVYDPKKKTWTLLGNADVKKMLTNDAQGLFRSDNHAWLFGWKNGTVLQAGPSKNMNWYYTEKKNGDVKTAGQRGSDRGIAPDAMCGNAVMFDAVNGEILSHGGTLDYQDADATTDAHIITIGSPGTNASVVYASNGLFNPRVFHSSVVLPNGNVFITGGQEHAIPFEDSTPQLQPEMYYPDSDSFQLMKANNIVRTYHSIALLLPDGRAFNGGGGLCGGCNTNHFDAQLYTPPYLYDSKGKLASRPKINSVSASTIKVGGTITVQTGGAIAQASLVRYGTATHTVNSDQRRIPLTLNKAAKNAYSFQVPSDPGVALPGYWMLFVMDKNGVPSVASTIKVTGS
ncbi:putative galactose oxidase precursor [Fusarium austroafricanum]|uniref:Putative galactose oxidase n=1 Tax=Fusarium austroafricanum TaxID=2364996 RepID=A0A8H4KCU9_9HYPO|nr:putative galactose oxidase precursor [Fusarium austroafricanum]